MESASPSKGKLPNVHLRTSSSGKLSHKKLAPLEDIPNNQLTMSLNSSKSIQHKKDLIEALRKTNPAGVNTAPVIFWDVEGALKTCAIDDSDVKQQMAIVENGVNYNVKRYNDLKVLNERLVKDLKSRLDELEQQKKQFENLDSMKKAQTEEGMRIEGLKEEIEHVENTLRDRNHYLRKLEHMLSRLKANKLKFDAHMVGMEDTLRSIEKDGTDIRLMRRGLDAGLAKALIVFEETKMNLTVARKDREILLEQRKQEYKNAKELEIWLQDRERMKLELGMQLRGDLTSDEEKFLKAQIEEKMEKTKNLQRASEEGLKKLQSMEEAFTRLKQVTGVKNVEEMHEKFSNQKSNKLQLELEVKDAEHRLSAAKKNLNKLETQFQELKSSGVGLAELNRENINRLEELYNEARNDQKSIRADAERISNVLLGLHQGAQGLLQRVHPYLSLTDAGVFELTQLGEDNSPWTETVDSLTTAEHVLSKMMEAISGDSTSANNNGYDDEEDNESAFSRESGSIDSIEEMPNTTNNIRIKSKRFLRDVDVTDEIQIPAAINEVEKDEVVIPIDNSADNIDDPNIPSRVGVKKFSVRRSLEAKRKEEMALRSKRLLDRVENKGGAAHDDLGDGSRFREQKAYSDKLCTTKSVPTLPDGVTLRDDAMTKTKAFLTALPKLT